MSDPYESYDEEQRNSYFRAGTWNGVIMTLFAEVVLYVLLHYLYKVI